MVVEWRKSIFTIHKVHVRLSKAKYKLYDGANIIGGAYATKLGYEA